MSNRHLQGINYFFFIIKYQIKIYKYQQRVTELHIFCGNVLSVYHFISISPFCSLSSLWVYLLLVPFWQFWNWKEVYDILCSCQKKAQFKSFWTSHQYWCCLIIYIPSMCIPIAECIYYHHAELHQLRKFPFLYWACWDNLYCIFRWISMCYYEGWVREGVRSGGGGGKGGWISLSWPAWFFLYNCHMRGASPNDTIKLPGALRNWWIQGVMSIWRPLILIYFQRGRFRPKPELDKGPNWGFCIK